MRPLNVLALLAAAASAVALAGCCSARHCDHAGEAFAKYHFETNSFQRALQARAEAPEEKIEMLVLSGGGSHGAWGAGVLRGWRENTANPRPRKFPVVTGAMRTLDMLLDANAIGDLYHMEYVLKLNGYGHFALSYIPPDLPVTASDVFDPKMMRPTSTKPAGCSGGRRISGRTPCPIST